MSDWFARYEEAVQQNKIDADVIKAQAATIERLRSYINAADALESCLALAGEDGTTCEAERAEAIGTYAAITREDMGEVE